MAQQLQSDCCYYRGLEFGSQHPCQADHNCLYFQFLGTQWSLWPLQPLTCTFTYTQIHQLKMNKKHTAPNSHFREHCKTDGKKYQTNKKGGVLRNKWFFSECQHYVINLQEVQAAVITCNITWCLVRQRNKEHNTDIAMARVILVGF